MYVLEDSLFGVKNLDLFLVIGILAFFIIIEVVAGHAKSTQRKSGDWFLELGSYLILALLIKPAIVLSVVFLSNQFIPNINNLFSNQLFLVSLLLYLLVDDFLQYWYHRSAHEYAFLWKLHRPHHQAEEMGFFVSYRNAALYYLIMPNLWWVGLFTFMGGAKAVALGLVLKQFIIISSHSTISYDKFLNKYTISKFFLSIWERIFITPAFHHAHHGKSKIDGISDPNGNFGNMFSIWDQLFGTAIFTRQFPKSYGLLNNPKEHCTAAYLYPLVKSNNPTSELNPNFKKSDTSSLQAIDIKLEANKNYLWCRCGMSTNQPFCDGSHHGTKFKPELFQVKRTSTYKLCNCKATKASPFCDDTHLKLEAREE